MVSKEFDSSIEGSSYTLLKTLSLPIDTHVPYSEIVPGSNSHFIADFLIDGTTVIEVSSFNRKHHPEYFDRIKLKQKLVEEAGKYFLFLNSLAEVKAFVTSVCD